MRIEFWRTIQTIRSANEDPERLGPLLEEFEKEYGPKYLPLVEKLVAEKGLQQWSEIAKSMDSDSLDALIKVLWEDWTEGEFTITRTENQVAIRCTRCPIADAYIAVGRVPEGLVFQCSEDSHMVAGFNPNIKFSRTMTLMDDDDCCDHTYWIE